MNGLSSKAKPVPVRKSVTETCHLDSLCFPGVQDQNRTEIRLLVQYRDGEPVYEVVPAAQLGENRFRILGSPGFAAGVAAGDEIAFDSSQKLGYRVLRRSGNICVQLFFEKCDFEARDRLAQLIAPLGGWLDGGQDMPSGPNRLLIFTIPVQAGFRAIEAVMAEIASGFPLNQWMYGNVYDTADGKTPLNWWLRPVAATPSSVPPASTERGGA